MENHKKTKEQLIRELAEMRRRVAELERSGTERKQTERALQESKERFRSLVETTSDWVWEIDRNGFYTYSSQKVRDLLGYEPEEIVGKTPFDFMSPHEADRTAALFEDIVKSQKAFSRLENINLHKDGRQIILETSGVPVFDERGSFLGYKGIDRDITERKRAEEALREGEAKYRSIFENSIEGICQTTGEGKFLMANPAFFRMLGYDSYDEMARSITNIRNKLYVNPEDRQRLMEIIKRDGVARGFETQFYKKDGSKIWVSINMWGVYDANGKFIYLQTIVEDITERKRLEHKLAAMSITDELTGLYNRRGFLTLTQQQLKIEKRARQDMLLFFADLDNMKQINDTMGHKEGDRALIDLAMIFKETFRESDIVGRMGGDEFAVFAINTTDETQKILATRLQNNLEAFNNLKARPYKLFLSIGVTHYDPEIPCSIDELITRADALMYEQKKNKRHST